MNAAAAVTGDHFAIDRFLASQENKSLLRFVACGSVDHGKSTLIGRLLYGANGVYDDQLKALAKESARFGTQDGELDFSLLLDGLAAEREQKITIDVAYRFFSTATRKYIVADTPGHEQYTRNMATGASTADVALILVDAASGLRPQTRRHAMIVSTVGVRNIALVVNKMDKVNWSEDAFRRIERDFRAFAAGLDVDDIVCIPVAAKSGDNVVTRSDKADWYEGPSVLGYLEAVDVQNGAATSFRMPVQWVNRPDSEFRGYSGTVAGGEIAPGDAVIVLPSGQRSRVARIVTYDGDLPRASAGQAVTVTLEDDIDASRGDVIAAAAHQPRVSGSLRARIVWMGQEPLVPGRAYILKTGAASTVATARAGLNVITLDTGELGPAAQLNINEIGVADLVLDRRIAVDAYADNRDTGSFILIDRDSFDTVAMGTIAREAVTKKPARFDWRSWVRAAAAPIDHADRRRRSIAKAVSWRAAGSIGTFAVAYALTRSTVWASSLVAAEIVVKIAIYYAHERVWSAVSWGSR